MKDRDYRRKQRERILTPEENTVHLMRIGQLEIVNEFTATKAEDIATRISLAAGLADIVPYQISNTEYLEISPPTIASYLGLPKTEVKVLESKIINNSGLSDTELRLFAADCAERVLITFEAYYPNDPQPQRAIETARRFALGNATQAELDDTHYAAYSAPWAIPETSTAFAAESAAHSAAWSATKDAGIAAWSAAELAAQSAAESAARSASELVAWSTAMSAAWSAELAWQKQRLAQYLLKLVPIG